MAPFGFLKGKSAQRDEFAGMLMNYLEKNNEPRPMQYRAKDFALVLGDDQVALESHYQRFLAASPQEHDSVMHSIYLDLQPPQPISGYRQVQGLLMPVLRSRVQSNNRALQLQGQKIDAGEELLQPFAGDLGVGLVIDRPTMMQPVVEKDLVRWQITAEAARRVALANLLRDGTPSFKKVDEDIFRSAWADGYDAARLLSPPLFKALNLPGETIAMASNADRVWVTGGRNPKNIAKLIELAAASLLSEGKPLTPDLLVLKGDHWQLWTLEPTHPAYGQHRDLVKLWMQDVYEQQQAALRQIYTDKNRDPYVATYAVARKNNRVDSYTAWTEGIDVPFWLPEADTIVFVPEDGEAFPVTWSHVETVLGPLPVVSNLKAPSRFEVRGFPSKEQLKAIRSAP
jgi:hypothetical protein